MDNLLTLEQAKELIRSKEHLYKAMVRNRWYLPQFGTSIITQDYLMKVRDEKIWCPKFEEIKLQPCPDPPNKDYLINEVLKRTQHKQVNIGINEDHKPDKKWLIAILSTLQYDHEIFQKDYLPPIKPPSKEEKVIDNNDSFFTGLPKLFRHKDLKKKSKLLQYQYGNQEASIKKLKEKKARLEQQIVIRGEKLKFLEKSKETVKISASEYEKLKSLSSKSSNITTRKTGRTPLKENKENKSTFNME